MSDRGRLILQRMLGEEIVIGGEIRVRVCGIQGGKVKLSIESPRDVPINRGEVQDAIDAEQLTGTPRGEAEIEEARKRRAAMKAAQQRIKDEKKAHAHARYAVQQPVVATAKTGESDAGRMAGAG
jgi:carbon storage regulator